MSTLAIDLDTDIPNLPPPVFGAGATLETALRQRRSDRSFSARPLSTETLSALLWAGCGVNRPDSGHRTAPSAHNWQEIAVYAVMARGAYRYDAPGHRLMRVSADDLRAHTGLQDFVGHAPLNLVYVSDFARMRECKPEERSFFVGADAAFVAQNVSLVCASAGLSSVVRAMIDRRRLAGLLRLTGTERIALAQSVGWPAGAA